MSLKARPYRPSQSTVPGHDATLLALFHEKLIVDSPTQAVLAEDAAAACCAATHARPLLMPAPLPPEQQVVDGNLRAVMGLFAPGPTREVPLVFSAEAAAALPVKARKLGQCVQGMLAARCNPSTLKQLLKGKDGTVARVAAAQLAVALLERRNGSPNAAVPKAPSNLHMQTSLRWLRQLVDAGLCGADDARIDGFEASVETTVAGVATLLLDLQAVRVILAGEGPASVHMLQRERHRLDGEQTPGFVRREALATEGFILGAASLRLPKPGDKARLWAIVDAWDDYLMTVYRNCDEVDRWAVRTELAVDALQNAFFYPGQQLIERLRSEAGRAVAGAAEQLFVYATASGQAVLTEQLLPLCAGLRWRGRTISLQPKDYRNLLTFDVTLLHRIAALDELPEALAHGAILSLIAHGADVRSLAALTPTARSMPCDHLKLIPASAHAAVAGNVALAAFLFRLERQASVQQRSVDLARIRAILPLLAAVKRAIADKGLFEMTTELQGLLVRVITLHSRHAWISVGLGPLQDAILETVKEICVLQNAAAKALKEGASSQDSISPIEYERLLQLPLAPVPVDALAADAISALSGQTQFELLTQHHTVRMLEQVEAGLSAYVAQYAAITAQRSAEERQENTVVIPLGALRLGSLESDGGPLLFFALRKDVRGLCALVGAKAEPDPWDHASAFAYALALARNSDDQTRSQGSELVATMLDALATTQQLWSLTYAALQFRDTADLQRVMKAADQKGVNLSSLSTQDASKLLALAAHVSVAALKALLLRLPSSEQQKACLCATDGAGDSLYHVAARSGTKVLETLSKLPTFSPALLLQQRNVSALHALNEAVLLGAQAPLSLMWQKRRVWSLEVAFVKAIEDAALQYNFLALESLSDVRDGREALHELCSKFAANLSAQGEHLQARRLQGLFGLPQQDALGDKAAASRSAAADAHFDVEQVGNHATWSRWLVDQASRTNDATGSGADSAAEADFSALESAARTVLEAPGVAKTEARLAAFVQRMQAELPAGGPHAREDAHCRLAWMVIAACERRAFGRFFGKHFFAHRPAVTDQALCTRMAEYGNYGASRFGPEDGPAILRVRQLALQKAEETFRQGGSGRYCVHLRDPGIRGEGFTSEGASLGGSRRFERASCVRIIVQLPISGERAAIVSMYPIALEQNSAHMGLFDGCMRPIR